MQGKLHFIFDMPMARLANLELDKPGVHSLTQIFFLTTWNFGGRTEWPIFATSKFDTCLFKAIQNSPLHWRNQVVRQMRDPTQIGSNLNRSNHISICPISQQNIVTAHLGVM